VIFSDSKKPPLLPEGALESSSRAKPPALLDQRDSLQGIGAEPFASPSLVPGTAMPSVDRAAIERERNWLKRSLDGPAITEGSAAKAFGVREYGVGEARLSTKRDGRWDGWLSDQAGAREASGKALLPAEARWQELSPAAQGSKTLLGGVTSGAADIPGRSSMSERNPVLFSDPDYFARSGDGSLDAVREPGRGDRLRDVANPWGLPEVARDGVRGYTSRENRETQPRQDEFRRLLGLPPEAPAANRAVSGTVLSGPADAVNLQPDLTRRELNPVVGRPPARTSNVKPGELPAFAGPFAPPNSAQEAYRPPALEQFPSRAYPSAALEKSTLPAFDQRKQLLSPTTLPVPKRTF
jgi:hypothetical protein